MANDQLLDPDLAALCDSACMWLLSCCFFAGQLGANVAGYITAQTCGRVASGYRPEAQRRATRHLSHCNGLPVVS